MTAKFSRKDYLKQRALKSVTINVPESIEEQIHAIWCEEQKKNRISKNGFFVRILQEYTEKKFKELMDL